MLVNSELVNCTTCEICFSQIIKPNQIYCKKCQVKTQCNKASNIKVHKSRLYKYSSNFEVLNLTKKYIGK